MFRRWVAGDYLPAKRCCVQCGACRLRFLCFTTAFSETIITNDYERIEATCSFITKQIGDMTYASVDLK